MKPIRVFLVVLLGTFLFSGVSYAQQLCQPDFVSLYEQNKNGLVIVRAVEREKEEKDLAPPLLPEIEPESLMVNVDMVSFGSGWVSDKKETEEENGNKRIIIRTADHVVQNERAEIFVYRVVESRDNIPERHFKAHKAKVLASDSVKDEAWLEILVSSSEAENFKALKIGDWRSLKTGMPVVALGHSLGMVNSLAAGHYSHPRRENLFFFLEVIWLQSSVPLSPGNSGGPLINACTGEVVGINTAYYINGNLVSRSTPIEKGGPNEQGGKTAWRGWLGLYLEDSAGGAMIIMLSEHPGASVIENIQPGDRVYKLNGEPVKGAVWFYKKITQFGPGAKIDLLLRRKGDSMPVKISAETRLLPAFYELETEINKARRIIAKTSPYFLLP